MDERTHTDRQHPQDIPRRVLRAWPDELVGILRNAYRAGPDPGAERVRNNLRTLLGSVVGSLLSVWLYAAGFVPLASLLSCATAFFILVTIHDPGVREARPAGREWLPSTDQRFQNALYELSRAHRQAESKVAAAALIQRRRIAANDADCEALGLDRQAGPDVDEEVKQVLDRLVAIHRTRVGLCEPIGERPGADAGEGEGEFDRTSRLAWESYDSNVAALDASVASTARRVEALAEYADTLAQLARAQLQLGRLEANEKSADAVEGILSGTSGDAERIEHLQGLRDRAAARRDAYRTAIDVLVRPVRGPGG